MTPRLPALVLTLLLAACSHSPPTREHSLFPPLDATQSDTGTHTVGTTTVVIVSCAVPETIDRPQWVVLDPQGETQVLVGERWIEPLKLAIPRVVAHTIQRTLPEVTAWSAVGRGAARADLRIRLNVAAWQAAPGRHARVDLVWEIDRGKSTRVDRGSFVVPVEGSAHADLLRAQRDALARASEHVARTVQAVLQESRQ